MNWLLFSCQQATELVEKREFVSLSLIESIRFKAHILVCSACRSYKKQSDLIGKMVHRMANSAISEQKALKMDTTAKAKIVQKLKEVK